MSKEEFCSGVKILLERMQSNPEDFEMLEFDMNRMTEVRGRFYEFAKSMECVVTGRNKQAMLESWTDWHMFTEAEQNALIEGYKVMRRNKFDAYILGRLMDTDYEKRQRDAIAEHQQAMYQKAVSAGLRASPLQGGTVTLTTTTSNGTSGGGGFISGLANSLGLK